MCPGCARVLRAPCAKKNQKKNDVQSVRQAGADKDKADQDGSKPLLFAAHVSNAEVERYLRERGDKPRRHSPHDVGQLGGWSKIFIYIYIKLFMYVVCSLFVCLPVGYTYIYIHIYSYLFVYVLFVCFRRDGVTPLFIACQEGRSKMLRSVCQAGADRDKADQDGSTPLLIAAHAGHAEVERYLRERGGKRRRHATHHVGQLGDRSKIYIYIYT